MGTTINTILVANRGEIAVRIMRTCRSLGIRTVAVYSDVDAYAPHVQVADDAVRLGPAPVAESYLAIDRVLEAAAASGADAVHPGYGFLSENAAFAEACGTAGLTFIGPPAGAISVMGDKAVSKRAMVEAGVPCIPGYQGEDQSDSRLIEEAGAVGFPLMVKAAAGGGGRGMRLVQDAGDLESAISLARSEAENAFGSGGIDSRESDYRTPARGNPGLCRSTRPHHSPGRTGLLRAAAASESGRGVTLPGHDR